MTGIFDSGVGGLVSLKKLRELCPFEDIIYLEDRKNAPYGIKGNEEIKNIVKSNIDRLTALGADRVLIACCTASCLLPTLGKDYESRAREIVKPAAFAAAEASKKGIIGVISTEATARIDSFGKELRRLMPKSCVYTKPSRRLVSMVEEGCRDGCVSLECKRLLVEIIEEFKAVGADTLILGCTHFSHLGKTVEELSGMIVVSPADEGAKVVAREINNKEKGKSVFIS